MAGDAQWTYGGRLQCAPPPILDQVQSRLSAIAGDSMDSERGLIVKIAYRLGREEGSEDTVFIDWLSERYRERIIEMIWWDLSCAHSIGGLSLTTAKKKDLRDVIRAARST